MTLSATWTLDDLQWASDHIYRNFGGLVTLVAMSNPNRRQCIQLMEKPRKQSQYVISAGDGVSIRGSHGLPDNFFVFVCEQGPRMFGADLLNRSVGEIDLWTLGLPRP